MESSGSPPQENPYAPPAGTEQDWAPGEEPGGGPPGSTTAVPKVFGVLSIVFGSIQLLFSLMQGCTSAFGRGFGAIGNNLPEGSAQAQQMKVMFQYMASIYNYMLIQALLFLVLSGILLAIGIGQIKYRRWAAAWTLYWGWAALAALGVILVISFVLIGPIYQKMFQAMASSAPSGALPASLTSSMSWMMGGTLGVVYIIFYSPYPILLLLFFSKARVKQAMSSSGSGEATNNLPSPAA